MLRSEADGERLDEESPTSCWGTRGRFIISAVALVVGIAGCTTRATFRHAPGSARSFSQGIPIVSADLVPSRVSWKALGPDTACRVHPEDDTIDGQGTVFVRHDRISLADCKFDCEMTLYCAGIEYSSVSARCEIWTRIIHHTIKKKGFECIVRAGVNEALAHLSDRISDRQRQVPFLLSSTTTHQATTTSTSNQSLFVTSTRDGLRMDKRATSSLGSNAITLTRHLLVDNVDYDGLIAKLAVRQEFESQIRDAISVVVGNGVQPYNVQLELKPGSVIVAVSVNLNGFDKQVVEAVRKELYSIAIVCRTVARNIASVKGIEAISTGAVVVRQLDHPVYGEPAQNVFSTLHGALFIIILIISFLVVFACFIWFRHKRDDGYVLGVQEVVESAFPRARGESAWNLEKAWEDSMPSPITPTSNNTNDDAGSEARTISMSSGSDNPRRALTGVNERDMERFAKEMEMFARKNDQAYGVNKIAARSFTKHDARQAYRNARGNPLTAIEQLYPHENSLSIWRSVRAL